MSVRTRANRSKKPGVSSGNKPGRDERRLHHKQVRRSTNVALSQMTEDEDVALPRPHSTRVDVDPSEKSQEKEVAPRRFKVWKTKAWKRRSVERRRRANRYKQALAEA